MTDEEKAKELADAITALGDVFLGRLPDAMKSMEEELHLIAQDNQDQTPWKSLHRRLHSMAGSAGMFDFPEIGNRARELEVRINELLKDIAKSGEFPSAEVKSEFIHDHYAFIAWTRANYIPMSVPS